MSDNKHVKITTEEPEEDGKKKITDESYYENLTYRQITYEKHIPTSRSTILADYLSCLDHLKDGAHLIDVQVQVKYGEPDMIIKKWVERREHYGRR